MDDRTTRRIEFEHDSACTRTGHVHCLYYLCALLYYLCQVGYVFIGVCLFVCLLAWVRKKLLDNRSSQNSRNGGIWATEETSRFWWQCGSRFTL